MLDFILLNSLEVFLIFFFKLFMVASMSFAFGYGGLGLDLRNSLCFYYSFEFVLVLGLFFVKHFFFLIDIIIDDIYLRNLYLLFFEDDLNRLDLFSWEIFRLNELLGDSYCFPFFLRGEFRLLGRVDLFLLSFQEIFTLFVADDVLAFVLGS